MFAALPVPLRIAFTDLIGHARRHVIGAAGHILPGTPGGFTLSRAARLPATPSRALIEGFAVFFATFVLLLHAAFHSVAGTR